MKKSPTKMDSELTKTKVLADRARQGTQSGEEEVFDAVIRSKPLLIRGSPR